MEWKRKNKCIQVRKKNVRIIFYIFVDLGAFLFYTKCTNSISTLVGKEDVMIILDYKDRRPLYEQIVDKFSDMILKGVLKPDEKLPSVRSLAMELSINPNTIQRAYMELEHKGFLYSVKGRGNFVSNSEQLKEERKREIRLHLTKELKEAFIHGIGLQEINQLVKEIYEGGDVHD